MADREPDEVRPRRALVEDSPADTTPPTERPAVADVDPEEPRPLYRDEVFTPVRQRQAGVDATQILPRTRRSGYGSSRSDVDVDPDELDDPGRIDDDRPRLGRRAKLALLVAAVAAVVVAGLVIGYAVLHAAKPAAAGNAASAPPGGAPPPGSSQPEPSALLTDAMMLSAAQVEQIDASRTWKVAATQRGLDDQSPQAACLTGAAQGQSGGQQAPVAQQTIVRLLSSSGSRAPGLLHQVDAYATTQEASQAYAAAASELGGCSMPGAYLESGYLLTGLGDQAVGAVVRVPTESGVAELRSVVLNRTGRVVNVVDVAQERIAAPVPKVAQALAAATAAQCGASDGRCSTTVGVTAGPPPPGGDQPGFLAPGDLPPVGPADATWDPTAPGLPSADFAGSGCETVNWAKAPARQRTARTYLHSDVKALGLDEIILTHASEQAAQALVARVKADLDSCARRKLTATVRTPAPVTGAGAATLAVRGWTATVLQKTTDGVDRYRVGIVSAGDKTVFTFVNPQPKLDLTDAQWSAVTLRAGQRATQGQ